MVTSGVEKQNNIRTIFQKIFERIPVVENMAIAASAGISSNALVFSSMAAGHKNPNIISFTFDDFESTDFIYAKRMAKYYNLPFKPVYLPSDQNSIINTVTTLINKYKLKKKARIECSFSFYYLAQTCKSLSITTLVTGLCDDGHFGLSKKAMIHYKHTQEKFDQFRHDYFSDPDAAGRKSINKICQDQDINLINPYCDPNVFKLFIGKSWDELNKPKQKYAIRKCYPELDKFKLPNHTNLQLGDSKIAQRVGNAVISKYKPNAKSPVGIYNRIAKGIYA